MVGLKSMTLTLLTQFMCAHLTFGFLAFAVHLSPPLSVPSTSPQNLCPQAEKERGVNEKQRNATGG